MECLNFFFLTNTFSSTVPRPRIQGYIEEVVDHYSDDEFRENFRMNRPTFNHVLLMISEQISSTIIDRGRHTISAKAQLLIALWHFGTPDSYRYIQFINFPQDSQTIFII